MEEVDITIVGAGVIGLAVSYLLRDLGKEITVVEKNVSFGQETSSRNSEVIHAGLYYPEDSLKARTCIRGRGLLYDLCSEHNIPYKKQGKLVVAFDKDGIAKIKSIHENALGCGVDGLRILDKKDIKKMEPDIRGELALFSPETGILDSHSLMKFFLTAAKEKDVDFSFSVEMADVKKRNSFYEVSVKEPNGDSFSFKSKAVINCAGLWADRIAEFVGIDVDKSSYRIHYCKGQYFRIRNPKKFSIKHLVYPPPSKNDLGIHLTPDLGGSLRLGPDAEYVSKIDYNMEEKRKRAFFDSVSAFLPGLEEDDLIPDTAGIRPKLQGENEGFRDFVIRDEEDKGFPNFINLIGIESPGLTSCLAIAEIVKKEVMKGV